MTGDVHDRLIARAALGEVGEPLTSHEVIVNLIGNTKTKTGLTIQAALDTGKYPIGIQVSDEDLAQVRMEKAEFHGEWNYCISPRPK